MSDLVLEVRDLKTQFNTENGVVTAVDRVSFSIKKGETLCIVGESGCGKSVTSMSLLKLLPKHVGIYGGGQVHFKGRDILQLTDEEMCQVRGKEIAMIFQDSMTALNPVLTIGKQLMETIGVHQKLSKEERRAKAIRLLEKVGIPSPEYRMKEYPHEISGGMRQRVMIAMALASDPSLLIADEPTTALDVTIQAQIIELMQALKKETGAAILLITHDLGVVAEMADTVLVMYAGQVMEYADTRSIFKEPKHPYTRGLMASIPRLDKDVDTLFTIKGTVPSLQDLPKGCRFCERCPDAELICGRQEPPMCDVGQAQVKCWKYADSQGGSMDEH